MKPSLPAALGGALSVVLVVRAAVLGMLVGDCGYGLVVALVGLAVAGGSFCCASVVDMGGINSDDSGLGDHLCLAGLFGLILAGMLGLVLAGMLGVGFVGTLGGGLVVGLGAALGVVVIGGLAGTFVGIGVAALEFVLRDLISVVRCRLQRTALRRADVTRRAGSGWAKRPNVQAWTQRGLQIVALGLPADQRHVWVADVAGSLASAESGGEWTRYLLGQLVSLPDHAWMFRLYRRRVRVR